MKKKLIALLFIASQFVLWGCYLEGPSYTDELDLVLTNYDKETNFAAKGTYSLPDKIVKITGDPTAPPEYIKDIYGLPMLARIDSNMQKLGWTKIDVNNIPPPDVQLLPAVWSTTTVIYGGYWGGYYCWYYPYYCGGGWYYPYTPVSSYTTGTMLMTLVDPNKESLDGSLRTVWSAALNGLLGSYDINRAKQGIDQAFKQSPYLKTN